MTPLPESLLGDTRWLRQLARSLVDDPHEAADVVQDTVVRALQLPPQNVERPRSFLAAVMRNLVCDRRRRERKRPEVERHAARRDAVPGTGDVLVEDSIRRSLIEAVQGLDEPYRGALWMRFFEGLPPREIAARLRVPVETARTRLKRGLAQLRGQLDREFGSRAAWVVPLGVEFGIPIGGAVAAPAVAASSAALFATAAVLLAAAAWLVWAGTPEAESARQAHARLDSPTPRDADAEAPPARVLVGPAVADAAPRPEVFVFGHVLDEQTRRPLSDVELHWDGDDVSAITDDRGRFRISVEGLGEDCELVARRSDFAETRIRLLRPESDLELGEVALPPGTRITGRVFDARGVPAVDTRILAVVDSELSLGWPPGTAIEPRAMLETAREVARTDRAGRFVVDSRLVPASTREVLVAVGDAGVGWSDVELRRSRHATDVAIRMRPDGRFAARCLDRDGMPLEGVVVTLEPRFAPFGTSHDPLADAFAPHEDLRRRLVSRTDSDGIARFRGVPRPPVPTSTFSARFELEDFAPLRIGLVALTDLESRPMDVRLERTRPLRLTGTVRDAFGRAVPDAEVVARSGHAARRTHVSRTDAYGRYVIEGLENSLHDAVALARADGFAASLGFTSFGPDGEARLDLELGDADSGAQPEEQPTERSLQARLVTASGGPLEAKSARLIHVGTRHALPLRLTIGRIEAEGLYPGDWLLRVTPHDGGVDLEQRFEVRSDQSAVSLTFVETDPIEFDPEATRDPQPETVTVRRGGQRQTVPLPRPRGS